MGEVYLAMDTKLGRQVALKILPEAFARDPERLARFEREAKTLASLNHPNIAQVYGFEDRALVMELLEGETLRDRIQSGALPTRKAIEYATQIARGLAAAHERGIIHRDLKPENVFVLRDGHVKILDFGLARQIAPRGSGGTETLAAVTGTDAGTVMGTVGYMAPEQVRGEALDARADLFALGAVLYEMLTGQRAFRRETTAETMTAILREDPPELSSVRADLSPVIDRIVRHCLEKNPIERFQTARDIAFALDSLSGSGAASAASVHSAAPKPARERWIWATLVGFLTAFAAWLSILSLRPSDAPSVAYRATVLFPEGVTFPGGLPTGIRLAISPDGRRVAFIGVSTAMSSTGQLWIHSLTTSEAHPIEGTDGAVAPFWSPDSKQVAFNVGEQLKRVDADGGLPVGITNVTGIGTWAPDGTLLVGRRPGDSRVQRTNVLGAALVDLLKPSSTAERFAYPFFLPGYRNFLVARRNFANPADDGTYVHSLDSSDTVRLLENQEGLNASYASGHLIFSRAGTLFAQPFDPKRRTLSGRPVMIAEGVDEQLASGASYSASNAGTLIYAPAPGQSKSRLVWMDREGQLLSTVSDEADYSNVELSPDGRRLAVSVLDASKRTRDIFIVDLVRGVRQRLTFDASEERAAIWSPDGRRIVYNSKGLHLYSRASDFTGDEEAVLTDSASKDPRGISSDGRRLLYRRSGGSTGNDLMVMPLDGDRKPIPILSSPFDENYGGFSPDGRSMVYVSDESGQPEVYVIALEGGGGKSQISTGGGTFPRWRLDGREILYLGPDHMLMSVPVTGSGSQFRAGTLRPLFRMTPQPGPGNPFDVTADGQRLIVNMAAASKVPPSLTLIVNWPALMPH
jgi:Tol biopolymer transport system component/predicted Ser/Thr protein kinase